MAAVDIPARVTVDALVKAVAQLSGDELEEFLSQVKLLRQRQADEADLLAVVQRRLPAEQQQRLDELRDKLEAETLTVQNETSCWSWLSASRPPTSSGLRPCWRWPRNVGFPCDSLWRT